MGYDGDWEIGKLEPDRKERARKIEMDKYD